MQIPHNIEVEREIIGSVLVERCVPYDAKTLAPTEFYIPNHQKIWQAICELDEVSEPIDIFDVCRRTGQSVSDVGQMTFGIPVLWDTKKAVKRLKTLNNLRTLQRGFVELAHKAGAGESVADLIDHAEGIIKTAKADQDKESGNARMLSIVYEQEVFPRLDKFVSGEAVKIPFGFTALDRSTNGGAGIGELIILGAKPKCGKSAFVLQCAFYQGLQNLGVYYCSREMLNYENGFRTLAQTTHYTLNQFKAGMYVETADILKAHARKYGSIPLALDDKSRTVAEMRKEILRLENEGYPITSVFVDYAQLVRSNSRSSNRAEVLEEIIYDLKELATDLERVVYVNAQFNREGIGTEKPSMSNFKGSSAIEMAGNLILLWTLKQEIDPLKNGRSGKLWIDAARNVAYDEFDITFYGERSLFTMEESIG